MIELLEGYKEAIRYVHEKYIECNIVSYAESEKFFIFFLDTPIATNEIYPCIIVDREFGEVSVVNPYELDLDNVIARQVPSDYIEKYSLFNNSA